MAGTIEKSWNKLPGLAQLAIVGGLGYLGYRAGKKAYDNYQTRKRIQYYQTQNVGFVTTTGGSTGVQTSINLSTVANEINDALYNNDWFGWTEDEDRAIDAVKQVPKPYIVQLQQVYNHLTDKDLQADLIGYLSADGWAQISYLFQ
jgi:hypothetical protein